MRDQPTCRVPHLRDSLIVAKVGIARKRDRLLRRSHHIKYSVAFAFASRYPKAGSPKLQPWVSLGLSIQPRMWGFSPWGLLSFPSHNIHSAKTS